ncbi:MAG: RHS repeat-associated core domain-containing protein [Fimbriimonadaceae bacterium]
MTQSGVTTIYTWDMESRIKQITKAGVTTNTFAYNGFDTRTTKTDSLGTNTYKRAGAGVTSPVLSDSNATYTPGISEKRGGTSRYLHSGLKNADSRTLADKSVEATREYDAFGNVIGSTGTWQGPFGNAGGFGYQEDPDHGLKLLGHRYYDSSTGRFLSRDPAEDGRNWYTYCENNPMSGFDVGGTQRKDLSPGQRAVYWANHLAEYKKKYNKKWDGPQYYDCGIFVRECVQYDDPTYPPYSTSRQKRYLEDNSKKPGPSKCLLRNPESKYSDVTELMAEDPQSPQDGDIAIKSGSKYGHTKIGGSDGDWYDASLHTRLPSNRRMAQWDPQLRIYRRRKFMGVRGNSPPSHGPSVAPLVGGWQ